MGRRRRNGPVTVPAVDESLMLDVPDRLALVDDQVTIEPGLGGPTVILETGAH